MGDVGKDFPEGWAEVPLRELLSAFEAGSRPRGGVRGIDEGVPSLGGEHLSARGGFDFSSIKYVPHMFHVGMNRGHINRGDVLVVKDGATTGKVSLVRDDFPFERAVVNEHVFICRPGPGVDPVFLFWFLWSATGQRRILENFQGSAQGGINQSFADDTLIPLPPLAEQRRIVAAVETAMARVDAARERLSSVLATLKRLRRAALAGACSGKLTDDWRASHPSLWSARHLLEQIQEKRHRLGLASGRQKVTDEGIDLPDLELPDKWVWCRVSDIAYVCVGGTPSRNEPRYWGGAIPWVSSGEVANCRISGTRERITEEGVKASSAKVYPAGSVLIAMIGEGKTRGQSAILDIQASTNQNVAGLLFDAGLVESEYIWLWALAEYETNREIGRGGNQPALNGRKVRALPIPLPPPDEQQEVVRRARRLLSLADAVDKRVVAAMAMAERLAQAVLSKAFMGELVLREAEIAHEGRSYEPA